LNNLSEKLEAKGEKPITTEQAQQLCAEIKVTAVSIHATLSYPSLQIIPIHSFSYREYSGSEIS
jgi:hypothetical protein